MKESPIETIPEPLLAGIRRANNLALFAHTHPDGDALGSLFGLARVLRSMGKNAVCFLEAPVSHLYDFLPASEDICTDQDGLRLFLSRAGSDIAGVALDCGDADRLGAWKDDILTIEPLLVIDHHLAHRAFGTLRWVEPGCSSTGEMVYELVQALGASLDYHSAFNLYVAICTDTGSFRYECTRPRTLRIAAELLDKGVRPEEVGKYLYDNFTRERLKLMELVLATITLTADGQIAFMHVSAEMLRQSGASLQDVEGFIDFPRSLRSVKIVALIKEGKEGQIAVSLRAKGECDVSAVARDFDGGGHRNAAGFRLQGKSIDEVRGQISEVLHRALP